MHRSGDKQNSPGASFFISIPSLYSDMNLLVFLALFLPQAQNAQQDPVRIVIQKTEFTLSLFRGDSLLGVYQIAVGRNPGDKKRVGDRTTPVGEFTISQIQNSASWVHDFGDGKGPIAGAYGPWFLRLKTPGWTGIGIHGTHDPASLGTMATEGCIRLSNEKISELKNMVTVGTPVIIHP
jgi:lipoprotein-anchoring transpeptidase ErfK/SrfK